MNYKFLLLITLLLISSCADSYSTNQVNNEDQSAPKISLTTPSPTSQPSEPSNNIAEDVKRYAAQEGFKCETITSVTPGQHWHPESPKYQVSCDNGKQDFIWSKLTNGEVTISPLF